MPTRRAMGRLPVSLPLAGARLLHMSATIGICYALGKLLLLGRVHIVQVDIIQQPLLDDLPQDLFLDGFGLG